MRILQVIHDFLPQHVGGSQIYCLYLSREMARRHSVSLFYTEADHRAPQYEMSRRQTLGLPAYQVVHNGLYRSFEETYADARMDDIFIRVLEEVRPDVVHIHHLMRHSLNYVSIARVRGIPVVFTLHDYWLSCPNQGQRLRDGDRICEIIEARKCAVCIGRFAAPASVAARFASAWRARTATRTGHTPEPMHAQGESAGPRAEDLQAFASLPRGLAETRRIYRAFEAFASKATAPLRVGDVQRRLRCVRRMCEMVDLFLAPSAFAATKMAEFGLPALRVIHSTHGMRRELFSEVATRRAAHSRAVLADADHPPAFRFGYVGAISHHKGVHVLLDAFRRVCRARPDRAVELRIHGSLRWDPILVAALRRRASGLPVRFLGEFDNAEAAAVYAEMDVLVVPSIWWENAPLTVDEARLAGVPVIAARIGGLAESIQHGVDGLLFRAGDAEALAAQMGLLMSQPEMLKAAERRASAVKTMEADSLELERRYQGLLDRLCPEVTAAAGTAAPGL